MSEEPKASNDLRSRINLDTPMAPRTGAEVGERLKKSEASERFGYVGGQIVPGPVEDDSADGVGTTRESSLNKEMVLLIPVMEEPGNPDALAPEIYQLVGDGRRIVPVYSSLMELLRCCGHGQRWVAIGINAAEIPDLPERFDVDAIVFDVPINDDGSPSVDLL